MGYDFVARNWGWLTPLGETANGWRNVATDFKYDTAQTPRPIEVHGYDKVTAYGELYAALKTAKIPVDLYLFPDPPHKLKSPLHRLRSLEVHLDWFRLWLQNYEDPSPTKQAQYSR